MSTDNLIKLKVEVLNGERGRPGDAAVRMKYLDALLQNLPTRPTARPAAGAPTKEEYDALREDVDRLYAAINSMRALLRG